MIEFSFDEPLHGRQSYVFQPPPQNKTPNNTQPPQKKKKPSTKYGLMAYTYGKMLGFYAQGSGVGIKSCVHDEGNAERWTRYADAVWNSGSATQISSAGVCCTKGLTVQYDRPNAIDPGLISIGCDRLVGEGHGRRVDERQTARSDRALTLRGKDLMFPPSKHPGREEGFLS